MENQLRLRNLLEIQQAAPCRVMVCYTPFSSLGKTNYLQCTCITDENDFQPHVSGIPKDL